MGKRHYYANKLAVKFHDEVKGEVADVERLISEKAIELKVKSNVV